MGLFSSISSTLGVTLITSNTTCKAENFYGSYLSVVGKETTLEVKNTQIIYVRKRLCNYGRIVLHSNAAVLKNKPHHVYFHSNGFYNEGLLAVRHEMSEMPIKVFLSGKTRPSIIGFGSWDPENRGTIILLSNGRKLPKEFQVQTWTNFVNLGSISVLGTAAQEANFEVREKKSGARLTNTGIIYVKHAALIQSANFTGDGCIVIGKKGRVFAQTYYIFEGQRFHFSGGSGTLMVYETWEDSDRRYYITNFPRGAVVRVKTAITGWRIEKSDLIITDTQGIESITFTFEGFTLEKSKIKIDGQQMSYAEDLVTAIPDSRCGKVDLVMAEARKYEIEA